MWKLTDEVIRQSTAFYGAGFSCSRVTTLWVGQAGSRLHLHKRLMLAPSILGIIFSSSLTSFPFFLSFFLSRANKADYSTVFMEIKQ